MLTFLPVMGLGQGVEVLVGRRQGERRPELSARTTWTGVKLATAYMAFVAVLYCAIPGWMAWPFAQEMPADEWARVGPLIPVLLRFVAAYSLADGVNIILAYALRGAGDTRFVVLVSVVLSWPLMVVPTWLVWRNGYGVQPAWAAATVYLAVTAGVYIARFAGGRWRTMTVIEAAVAEPDEPAAPEPAAAELPTLRV
jgi:MATE family multidrug resistance protein